MVLAVGLDEIEVVHAGLDGEFVEWLVELAVEPKPAAAVARSGEQVAFARRDDEGGLQA